MVSQVRDLATFTEASSRPVVGQVSPGCFVWAPGVLEASLVLCYVAATSTRVDAVVDVTTTEGVPGARALVLRMDRRKPLEWIPLQGLILALLPLPELMPDEDAIFKASG